MSIQKHGKTLFTLSDRFCFEPPMGQSRHISQIKKSLSLNPRHSHELKKIQQKFLEKFQHFSVRILFADITEPMHRDCFCDSSCILFDDCCADHVTTCSHLYTTTPGIPSKFLIFINIKAVGYIGL